MPCKRIATSTLDFSVATQLETRHVISAPLHIQKLETCCNLCMYVAVVAFGVLVLFGFSEKKNCVWLRGSYFTYFITIFYLSVCLCVCECAAPIIIILLLGCCCFSYKNQLYFLVTVSRYTPKATWLLDLIAIRAQYVHTYIRRYKNRYKHM